MRRLLVFSLKKPMLAQEMRLRRRRRAVVDGRFVNRPYGTGVGRIAAGLRPSQ